MPTVQIGDKRVQFPDTMGPEDIQTTLNDRFQKAKQWGVDNSKILSFLSEMRPEDMTALGTSMIPGVGDIAGAYADYTDIKENWDDSPWTTKAAMVGGAALGALPFVPSRSQVNAAGDVVKEKIKALHASPHDFDRFSMDAIGTGEGAQAYGYGLYFAENPAVKDEYLEQFSQPRLEVDGKPANAVYTGEIRERFKEIYDSAIDEPMISEWVNMRLDDADDFDAAYEKVDGIIEKFKRGEEYTRDFDELAELGIDANEIYDLLDDQQKLDSVFSNISQASNMDDLGYVIENFSPEEVAVYQRYVEPKLQMVEPKAWTYEVEIDASPDEFLDWDKPLSEQSEAVRKALGYSDNPNLDPKKKAYVDDFLKYDSMTEQDLYESLTFSNDYVEGMSPEDANVLVEYAKANRIRGDEMVTPEFAERARQAGIKGIRYKDGFSRGAEGGTSNYVVFDESIITIAKKYGIAIPAAAAMLYGDKADQYYEKEA
jgi:hypothetical protein